MRNSCLIVYYSEWKYLHLLNKLNETNMTTTKLNKEQTKIYKSLVRLGDSKEVALKTALEATTKTSGMYRLAYQ